MSQSPWIRVVLEMREYHTHSEAMRQRMHVLQKANILPWAEYMVSIALYLRENLKDSRGFTVKTYMSTDVKHVSCTDI